jgi:hypothetical protein
MRLPIEGYSTSRKKKPRHRSVWQQGLAVLANPEKYRVAGGALSGRTQSPTFSRRVPAAVTLRNVVSKPAVPPGCSPLRK